MTASRYLGTWRLPSGNACDVYLHGGLRLECQWDRAPSPSWPRNDLDHWERVTYPAILQAVADATGQRVMGMSL